MSTSLSKDQQCIHEVVKQMEEGEEVYIPEDIKVAVMNILYNSLQSRSYRKTHLMPITEKDDLFDGSSDSEASATSQNLEEELLRDRLRQGGRPVVMAPREPQLEDASDIESLLRDHALRQTWESGVGTMRSDRQRREMEEAYRVYPGRREESMYRQPMVFIPSSVDDPNPFQDRRMGSMPPGGVTMRSRTGRPFMSMPQEEPMLYHRGMSERVAMENRRMMERELDPMMMQERMMERRMRSEIEEMRRSDRLRMESPANRKKEQGMKQRANRNGMGRGRGMDQSMSQRMDRGIDQRMDRGIDQRMDQRMDQSMNRGIDQRMDQRMDQPMNPRMDPMMNPMMSRNGQLLSRPSDPSRGRRMDQPVNPRMNLNQFNRQPDRMMPEMARGVERMRLDPRMGRRDYVLEQPMGRVPVDRMVPNRVPMEPMGRGVEKAPRRRQNGMPVMQVPGGRERDYVMERGPERMMQAPESVRRQQMMSMPMQMPVQMQMPMQMQIPGQIPGQIPVQMSMPVPMQMPVQMPMQMPVQIPMQVPVASSMTMPMASQQSGTASLKKKATVNANAKPFIPAFARKSSSL